MWGRGSAGCLPLGLEWEMEGVHQEGFREVRVTAEAALFAWGIEKSGLCKAGPEPHWRMQAFIRSSGWQVEEIWWLYV